MAAGVAILNQMTVRGKDSASVAVPGFQGAEGLKMADELAQRLLGAMHEGVLVFDQDAKAIFANARAIEIVGIPFSEIAQQRAVDPRFQPILADGRALPWEERPTATALRTGQHCSMTLGVPKPTGLIWVVFNAEPLFREGEERPYGVITVLTDITEHKTAELALHRSEELKSAIMAASLDAILTLTRDGEIVDLNSAAVQLYKTTRDAAVGDHMTSYIPARDREVWEQLLERLREDPTHLHGRRIEGTGRRSDGSEFPFEASINSLEAGQRQFFVTFVHDITDRKASERRLADARDAALRASVVKSEFLATMSHEIRTPMNGVIGSLDLMLDSELAPELAELAQIARTAANDLLAIIDDILDLSKIEADKVERQQAIFELVSIVEGVADIVAVTARQKGVALATYIDPQLPTGMRGDARLLRQILVNLVGNAMKFTDHGEVVIRAERQPAAESQALVRFTVRDSGSGIPPDALATLFEPFTQVDGGATRAHGGSGLGLAISSRLVRLMGGKLTVDSELGRGSTFSFSLPFTLPEEPVVPAPPPTRLGRPLRVLIVDTSDTSAETVERYLRAWGMVPTRVPGAAAALERFTAAPASERFDVAILAASARDEGAPTLARDLHARAGEEGVFVIALLEIGERLVEPDGASSASFDAVVGKPIKQSRLYDALSGIQTERAAAEVDEVAQPPGELSGLRVLVAEDNPVNQQVLLRQAQRLGMVADAVNNGQEVLNALEGQAYDVVLMDCQMPVMDGYTATRAIRSREQDGATRLPIVAVTANAMREDFERCRESGMDDFVAKPVTLAALANAIERAVTATRDAGAQAGAASSPAATPAPPPPPSDAVDRVALGSLQDDLGGPDALLRIVRLFLEQLDPQAEQIEAAAKGGEHETLARNAHRMRSSAATLGASGLAEILSALEAAARDGDAAACDQLAATFAAQVAVTRTAFEVVIEELDTAVSAEL
jgi:two-component system sensor histidine kinase/response regulator